MEKKDVINFAVGASMLAAASSGRTRAIKRTGGGPGALSAGQAW